jgi:hypothetical protein
MEHKKIDARRAGFYGALTGFAVAMYEGQSTAAMGFIGMVIFFAVASRRQGKNVVDDG